MHPLAAIALLQMPWTTSLPARGMSLDFLRPKFDGGETSLTSGAAFLSARLPAGSSSIKIELPYAHVGAPGVTSSTIGNPYIGMEKIVARNLWFEGGVRLPVTSDNETAASMGLYSDVTRWEAFFTSAFTITVRVRHQHTDSSGFTLDAGIGPSLWASTEGGDPEVVVLPHLSAGYRRANAWMAFGIGGLFILTENLSLGERTIAQLGVSAGLSRGQVRPAVHFMIPLEDEIKNTVDLTVGLGVAVAFP